LNWLDLCIIIIISLNGFIGLSRGLILSLFSIGSYIVGFMAAKLYYPYLSQFIMKNTNIITRIQGFIFNRIEGDIGALQRGPVNPLSALGLPRAVEEIFLQEASLTYGNEILEGFKIYISQMIGKMLIDLLSIIIIFLFTKALLGIIGGILNNIASIPVIRQFNSLGGFFVGLAKGLLIVYILTALLVPAVSIFKIDVLREGLNNSAIASYFYDENILLKLIGLYILNL